ncbi:hypothetical protein JZ751_026261 [Albula glossodonta]|uniref:Noggin n=1 Tax=Albula glossodonta TaxID=121402 RepID=A0A8T2PK55_9TELE|nr:hypothetical protein JZ751_026261 [Albula glossodonta]
MGFSQALLVYVFVSIHLGVSQHFLRLRPSPSEHLPVPDLKEDPDPEHDPREQDLAERTLRKKLGSYFDPNFMSISSPLLVNQSVQDTQVKPPGPIPNEIKKLDLSETPYGRRVKVGKKARRKFLQWLWTYTHCPVVYSWKDLGVRFWPRYIKEGNCFNERSCSFPEGMFCKPIKSITKTFLRALDKRTEWRGGGPWRRGLKEEEAGGLVAEWAPLLLLRGAACREKTKGAPPLEQHCPLVVNTFSQDIPVLSSANSTGLMYNL